MKTGAIREKPRRTVVCRHVSHRVVYSSYIPEIHWHAMGSKNSAYAGASGAHHLARRPDSVFIGCEMRKAATTRLSNPHISGWERGVGVLGESVHGVAPDAQHRARLVGAEYRVGGYDGSHLSPANALGHGRSRAPFRLEAPSRARPRAAPRAVAAVISCRSSTRCRRPRTPSTPGASCRACTSRSLPTR